MVAGARPFRGDEIAAAARLLAHLPGYLRQPIRPEQARAMLSGWRERREADFLALLRKVVFANPTNPYQRLLRLAGCEPGDVERLVASDGLEGALEFLFRQGVYLSVDEFKGRRAVVRGSDRFEVGLDQLRMPGLGILTTHRSSGSRGARTGAHVGIGDIRVRAVAFCAELEARGGLDWVKAIWLVAGDSIGTTLVYSGFGAPLARWFTLVSAATPGLDSRYRLAERAVSWGARLAGVRLPRTEQVPFDDPLPIATWMAALLHRGQVPHLYAYLSPVVRLCQAARDAGLDLTGAQFTVIGEPLTPARVAAIRQAGAKAMSRYGSAELGIIGVGCLAPAWSDEHHVPAPRVAVIPAGSAGPSAGLPPETLLGTSLRPEAPFFVINLSTGDQAAVVRRNCDCSFERMGWTTHLHSVRSFEKLTAAGMTFHDTDVIRVLEQVLPDRFGGGPTQYQLVESEAPNGQACLRLLIDPAIGQLDEASVREAFLAAIEHGTGAERIMAQVWRVPGFLQVERRPPLKTAGGKVLHIHRAPPRPPLL